MLSTEPSTTQPRCPLVRASRDLLRALANGVRAEGLRLVDLEVLRCAVGAPGSVEGDLAAVLGVDPSAIAVALDRLEKLACTKRDAAEGERRRRVVDVTAVGHRTLRRCAVIVARVEEEFFAGLDDEEQTLLGRLLARLPSTGPGTQTTPAPEGEHAAAPWSVPHPPGSRRWS